MRRLPLFLAAALTACAASAAPLMAQAQAADDGSAINDPAADSKLDITPRETDPVTGVLDTMQTETNPYEDTRIQPVINTTWVEHCSGCHVAYQPALLTAVAWRSILKDLPDHFGERIPRPSLDDLTEMEEYARRYAGRPGYGMLVDVDDPDASPRRITDLPVFTQVHQDVTAEAMQRAGGAWRCEPCHAAAGRGFYGYETAPPAAAAGVGEGAGAGAGPQ